MLFNVILNDDINVQLSLDDGLIRELEIYLKAPKVRYFIMKSNSQ